MKRLLLFVLLLSASFSWAQEKKPLCIYGFNPFHVTEENLGIAFSYERYLDDKGIFSVYLPLAISFPRVAKSYDYAYSFYSNATTDTRNLTYFTAYPGIKIYPGGSNKRVAYAVGASLVMALGQQAATTTYYKIQPDSFGRYLLDYQKIEYKNAFKFGMLITNSLNVRPTSNFYFGVEFGLGYTYLNALNAVAADRETLVQFGLKFGYVK